MAVEERMKADGFGWRFVLGAGPVGLLFAALTITGSLDGVRPTKWVALGLLLTETDPRELGIAIPVGPPLRHCASGMD